jgi:diacylglycerol kinase family enzyme
MAGGDGSIDVGRADERLFLNNVSLGVYARLVHRRERRRRRRQAFARIRAWTILLTHRQPLGITIDGEAVETRLVLVANNAYALELPSLGERERLDEGKLHLYSPGADPPERVGERFVVAAASGRLEAAVDGEPDRPAGNAGGVPDRAARATRARATGRERLRAPPGSA